MRTKRGQHSPRPPDLTGIFNQVNQLRRGLELQISLLAPGVRGRYRMRDLLATSLSAIKRAHRSLLIAQKIVMESAPAVDAERLSLEGPRNTPSEPEAPRTSG